MKRSLTMTPLALLAVLLAAAIWVPASATAGDELHRLAADPKFHGPHQEAATNAEPPGMSIYDKTVFVPRGANVLYLTISTTGDTHGGAAGCFTALADGKFFNAGGQGAARCSLDGTVDVPGWVALVKLPAATGGAPNCNDGGGGAGDCHDNSIHYEWCTPITPGAHAVQVRMATSGTGKTAFIEQAFFYVDASRIKRGTACGVAVRPGDDDDDKGDKDDGDKGAKGGKS